VSRDAAGARARLVRFDLAERRLLLPTSPAPAGLAPRTAGLPIDGWEDTTAPTLAGKPLPLEPYEASRSLAISADRQRFALGSDWDVIEAKYPTSFYLADSVTCDVPRIEPFNATFTLADVAPAAPKG
jgi:hypothetical protein